MKVKRGKSLALILLSLLFAIVLSCFAGLTVKTENKTVQAASTDANDMWNGNSFDLDELKSLYTLLTGKANATIKDVSEKAATPQTSADFRTNNGGNDINVTIGGIKWTATYMGLSSSNDVFLTLWALDSGPSVKYNQYGSNSNGNTPANMYGTSYIRAEVLNAGGGYANSNNEDYNNLTGQATKKHDVNDNIYALFTSEQCTGNLTKYIMKPKDVPYQETENGKVIQNFYTNSNDAWGTPSGTISCAGGAAYNYIGKAGYTDWANDYIWLPSFTEAGIFGSTVGLWKTSATQRDYENKASWTRSCRSDHCSDVYPLKIGGGFYDATVTTPYYVRPAFHLNLSSIGKEVKDVEVTYNGGPQTLADVAADDKAWYDSSVMNLTYLTTSMKDVGTYTVKAELTAQAIADGEAFLGDPDPSKGNGDESATLRYFNFKITPKTLNATLAESGGIVSLTLNSSDLCGTDSLPPTAIRYTSTDGKGYNSTTAPQQKGSFKAEPEITAANCNYSLKSTPASVTFTINAVQVNMPTMPPTAVPEYDGTTQTVTLSNYTHNGKGVSIYEVKGKTSSNADVANAPTFNATNGEISFKDAGVYTVTIVLEDVTNCVWKSDGTNGRKDITFTVKPKQLTLSVSNDNSDLWAWGVGTAVQATVTLNGIVSGDNVTLKSKYAAPTGAEVPSSGTSNGGDATVSDTITLPANLVQGSYTLTAEIDNENYDIADGLTAAGMPLTFAIGAQVFDPSTFTWTYSENGVGNSPIADGDNFLKYKLDATGTPFKYALSINLGAFTGAFRTLTATDYTAAEQTNAGSYTTKVKLTIKNTDYSFDTTKVYSNATVLSTTEAEVYINWSIEKGDFTGLDTLPWVYRYGASGSWTDYNLARPPEFGNGMVTVKMKGDVEGTLKGLTFNYGGVNSERNKGEYTVKMSFGVTDSNNFNIPQGFDFKWKITKKIINVQWEQDVALTYTGTAHPEWHGNEYLATQLRYEKPEFADKVEYIYSCTLPDGSAYTGRGVEALAYITEQALSAQKRIEVEVTVELKADASTQNDYELSDSTGGNFTTSFMVGDSKLVAKVNLKAEGEYGAFDYKVEVTGEDMDSSKYTVEVYKGTNITEPDSTDNVKIENFDPKTADAGDYFIVVKLTGNWADEYRLSGSKKAFSILPKKIAVPTLGDVTFTGGELNIAEYLGGSWADYKDIITLGGEFEGIRNVKEGGYVATLTLTSGNYCWDYGSGSSTVKYSLSSEVTAEGTDTVASYKWNVSPLIVDASNMWSKGKNGATLNLPANIKSLIDAGTLTLGYRYYDGASGEFIESPELAGGKSFKVEAAFGGLDAENGNVVFKTGENEFGAVSTAIDYTVPQSGAKAFFGNALSFLKSNWLWFVIGLAALLLLIILICIIAKRRKNKEERLAKKQAKEEEKRRKEEQLAEEKRRKEEEREAEKRRHERELELEKAKQEAELAKMKAQLSMGAGAGAMAMQAMQPQQQMPMQPMQYMPPQYQQPQYPQYPPMPQQPYPQMPQQSYDGGSARINQLEMEVAKLKAESDIRTVGMDERAKTAYFAPMQASPVIMQNRESVPEHNAKQGMTAEILGEAILTAITKLVENKANAPVQAIPVSVEKSKPVSVAYPPDAVVTTTTTVDTTKAPTAPKPQRITREDDNKYFDIDGFYDTFEEDV